MGGGREVDLAIKKMISKSGGGDFIIIRTDESDKYNPYIYDELGGVNSVETIIIDTKEKANNPLIEKKLRNAEALFIAGGDQAEYYAFWKNSKVSKSIEYLINQKKAPVGGTSAGLAILGQFVFTAENDTITADENITSFDNPKLTIRNDFLKIPLMKNIITDSHFSQRNRSQRLNIFMNKIVNNKWAIKEDLEGIGIDEETALLIYPDSTREVMGKNKVYSFKLTDGKWNEVFFNSISNILLKAKE